MVVAQRQYIDNFGLQVIECFEFGLPEEIDRGRKGFRDRQLLPHSRGSITKVEPVDDRIGPWFIRRWSIQRRMDLCRLYFVCTFFKIPHLIAAFISRWFFGLRIWSVILNVFHICNI